MESRAVENFREYIRINTAPPNAAYGDAMLFLNKMAQELGLKCKIVELVPDNPICLMEWEGQDPTLPSVLLNSHVDVVPVYPEHWKYDPFEAVMTENGDIYGRGTQDMKCVSIQYLEAIRVLKSQGFKPLRTINLSFVPDEETGGIKGMVALIDSPHFKPLNVGFAMDEGMASPDDTYVVYYGERSRFVVHCTAVGNPGHGSQFIADTAAEKILKMMNKFQEYRDSEKAKWQKNPQAGLGDCTTCNLTIIEGGVLSNVVPSEIKAIFDCRVTTKFPANDFRKMVYDWATECGIDHSGIFIDFFHQHLPETSTVDNPWWDAFQSACSAMNMKTRPEIFPAATDSRYIRGIGIPALGFSPMSNTPILLHDHNEFLNRETFLNGIKFYVKLIAELSQVKA